jgi:tetratricopeptide (TPR) repeat protein
VDVLQAVQGNAGENAAALQRHLRDLSDLGVWPATDVSPEESSRPDSEFRIPNSYVFRNVTTQEVAYGSLPYERRRELHRRIGEFIESHPALADDLSGLLTYHYFEGQLWDKVLPYALEAGQSAQEKYANAAAAGAYRRALQAAESLSPPRKEEQLAAHESLADVLLIAGDYGEALQHYEQARALAEDDLRHLSDLCRKTAETHERRSAYEEAFSWLSRGLQYATPDSLEAARIYLMGASVYYRQGKDDKAIEWWETSLTISRALTDDDARRAEARALYSLANVLRKRGNLKQAIAAAEHSRELYESIGDLFGMSQALTNLATAHQFEGNLAQATHYFQQGLQIKEQIGDVYGQAMITLNLGEVYRTEGELEAARRIQTQSLRIWRELGNSHAIALLGNNLAATAIAAGDWEQAVDHLVESEKLFDAIGADDFKAELQRHWAELSLGRGRLRKALGQFRRLLLAESQRVKSARSMCWPNYLLKMTKEPSANSGNWRY